MAKRIKNPIEVKATVTIGDNGIIGEIIDASCHYGLSCDECGRGNREGSPLEQNQEILNIIKDFVEESVKQIEAKLEIPAEDSILHVEP